MIAPHPVQLVAVVGGSGAGKTWFVERVCRVFAPNACQVQLDDFYRDLSHLPLPERARENFDVPESIDWAWAARVLRACRNGEPAAIPRYDFATHCRIAGHNAWEPRPLVLVDGLWLLHPPEIRSLFALKIFLDAPAGLRRRRRLARDVAERGYTRDAIEHQLRTAVVPMHDRYVERQKKWADVILTQPFQERQIADLCDRLLALAAGAGVIPAWEHESLRAGMLDLLAHHEYCN